MTSLPKNWILKPMADEHLNDAKSGKLLIISPLKASEIQLKIDLLSGQFGVVHKGTVLHTLKYHSPYEGGGFRYYSTEWGYFVADRAHSRSGSPLCEVWLGGKKYGVVNCGFRQNEYR